MSANSSPETLLKTATILEHAEKRQQASQLVLLAIVDKESSSIGEVRHSLQSCLAILKETAQKDFYFDLGWLETPNTVLDCFVSLNMVETHHSTLAYQSTKIGRTELVDQWQMLESYLGMSLRRFQEFC